MSVFRSRPALRWLVPSAAAVIVIGGGAAAGTIVASADPSLPDRSAAQLLVDIQNAKVDGLSGTIVESADLGLPAIAGLAGGSGSTDAGDLTSLLAGSNTARVWYAGEDKMRLALVGTKGETDVIRNQNDVWLWNSAEKSANHLKLPADGKPGHADPLAGQVPKTPQEAADAALAAIDPTTTVTTTGAAKVAGRDAYELVLSPKDSASLIGQVRLAIDAEHHIPLRVDVYAKNATSPAVRVAFQQISFAVPDAEQFTFNPPPDTKVTEGSAEGLAKEHQAEAEKAQARAKAQQPQVIGDGWTAIVEAKLPKSDGTESQQLDSVLKMLPAVSGSWGSGHQFAGTLFTVLVTDDGRVFAGAVTPEKLYEAAAK
ncbi:LolA family protein [Paractinoplanes globisporus]|uniref:Outer membrane lipoprotein carrier protein LolA n=1 Tax=Paractinoplanes globisporus TaxID=113565 RepID=A0ABW6WAW6_9ACTN|nr:sigma-E factor regulatory protein RseB domain-containing protein [Actinoplanes globisporus]